VLPWLVGCGHLRVNYTSLEDTNNGRRSVTLEMWELSRPPETVTEMTCETFALGARQDGTYLGVAYPKLEELVRGDKDGHEESVLASSSHFHDFKPRPGRKFLMVIPRWSSCDEATGWAIVRAGRFVREIDIELQGNRIVLPWEKGRRQRGWVDGQPYHVLLPANRPRDR
jgi:hypothetical protein